MITYELYKSVHGEHITKTNGDILSFVPNDPANTDYQQYLIDTDGGLPIPTESEEE